MNLRQIFGKNVRYFRYKKRYTQETFAELVDLNTSYISEVESGKYGPAFDKVEIIADALEVEPYVLFRETEYTHEKLPNRVDKKL